MLELTPFAPYPQQIHCHEYLSPRKRECSQVLLCYRSIFHTDSMV